MNELKQMQHDYGLFEQRIQQLMNRYASPYCAVCQNCCCQHVICEESLLSPFLLGVHTLFPPAETFCDSYGWLSVSGCTLPAGRPPVCYEFLCDMMMNSLPDDDTRYALRTLGMLLTHLGRNALGNRHLIEITDPDMLHRIQPGRLKKRLLECQYVLDDLTSFFSSGKFRPDARERMSKVCRPDINLYQGE